MFNSIVLNSLRQIGRGLSRKYKVLVRGIQAIGGKSLLFLLIVRALWDNALIVKGAVTPMQDKLQKWAAGLKIETVKKAVSIVKKATVGAVAMKTKSGDFIRNSLAKAREILSKKLERISGATLGVIQTDSIFKVWTIARKEGLRANRVNLALWALDGLN